MGYSQGEIVEVNFKLPEDEFKPHPVVVISNDEINEIEEAFVGVMISSSTQYDNYSYLLESKMLTTPTRKPSQVRCHLISLIENREVIQRFSSVKSRYVREIAQKILADVFDM